MILLRSFLIFLLIAASPAGALQARAVPDMAAAHVMADAADMADCCLDGTHRDAACQMQLALIIMPAAPLAMQGAEIAWIRPAPNRLHGLDPPHQPRPPKAV